tara:strand:+ start:469 stop:1437 length:969 start_codon:yes stop_codon:yes gene_type:complete
MTKKPILIVAGEPYSIFSEIFFKSLKKINLKRPLVLIASKKIFKQQMKKLGYKFYYEDIDRNLTKKINNKRKIINIIDVQFNFKKTFDKISDKSNSYISECFFIANTLLKNKKAFALINGPISKENFLKAKYLGITEYLAKMNDIKKFAMLIYNKRLSVSPITTHIAIKKISSEISKKKIINQVSLIRKFYYSLSNKNIKIGITGLNPHCESNFKDSEEKSIITPAIKYLKKKNYKVIGPLPADSLFMDENRNNFDVVIGMYHDQVLTPIKTIHNFDAINITLGLPYLRISPDHGTNNQMIGKNRSNYTSLFSAIKFLTNYK